MIFTIFWPFLIRIYTIWFNILNSNYWKRRFFMNFDSKLQFYVKNNGFIDHELWCLRLNVKDLTLNCTADGKIHKISLGHSKLMPILLQNFWSKTGSKKFVDTFCCQKMRLNQLWSFIRGRFQKWPFIFITKWPLLLRKFW